VLNIQPDEPLAVAAVEAIHSGNIELLQRLLHENPSLATARIAGARTLLHIATDWPGHFPNGAATVGALIAHGAEVNARSSAATRRPHSTGPPVATTLQSWMRCWITAPA
jgi:hypothetical protein